MQSGFPESYQKVCNGSKCVFLPQTVMGKAVRSAPVSVSDYSRYAELSTKVTVTLEAVTEEAAGAQYDQTRKDASDIDPLIYGTSCNRLSVIKFCS